jgi:DHA1 family bicyclomycin/chloramphenicol resistance-like MFS transporter
MNISSEAIDNSPNISVNNSRLFLVLFLGVLAAIGPFVMDLYLPALPSVVTYFDTSMPTVQLSLTSCMVGLAVGQLIIGPLSDKYGRKMPLLICITLFALSGIGIVMAENMQTLISFRFLQGISSAGGVVIARAAAADLYEGPEMARFFALLMSVNGVAPIIAPVIGSLLLEITDWHGIFAFQAGLGILLFIACLRFQESLNINKRHDGEIVVSVR